MDHEIVYAAFQDELEKISILNALAGIGQAAVTAGRNVQLAGRAAIGGNFGRAGSILKNAPDSISKGYSVGANPVTTKQLANQTRNVAVGTGLTTAGGLYAGKKIFGNSNQQQ